jgi:hypothetical protein
VLSSKARAEGFPNVFVGQFHRPEVLMLGLNATTGQALCGLDHLRQSIKDILTTRIGTRVMRRDYGSRLPDLVDNPMTPRLAMELYAATVDALDRWEPRLKLTRVKIASAAPGRVVLDLEGIYLPDGRATVLAGLEV